MSEAFDLTGSECYAPRAGSNGDTPFPGDVDFTLSDERTNREPAKRANDRLTPKFNKRL